MMIDDDDPRMLAAARECAERLIPLVAGREYNGSLDRVLRQELYDHRIRCKRRGVDFPPMTIMAVPRLGAVCLYRADLEPVGIRGAVLQFARIHPDVTSQELATAVLWAWPHIKPETLVDESMFVIKHDQARRATNAA